MAYTQHQDLCIDQEGAAEQWPPLDVLQVVVSKANQSCDEACGENSKKSTNKKVFLFLRTSLRTGVLSLRKYTEENRRIGLCPLGKIPRETVEDILAPAFVRKSK